MDQSDLKQKGGEGDLSICSVQSKDCSVHSSQSYIRIKAFVFVFAPRLTTPILILDHQQIKVI